MKIIYLLKKGDHACFKAGIEEAHHIENTSNEPLKYLVFGKRNHQDVVFYPELEIMLVKAMDNQVFKYETVSQSEDSEK